MNWRLAHRGTALALGVALALSNGGCIFFMGHKASPNQLEFQRRLGKLTPRERDLLYRSREFQRVVRAVASPVVMVDSRDEKGVDVYLGEAHEDHIVRSSTVRINADRGTVERMEYDAEGEIIWVDDLEPLAGRY